jgi:hypothetical protein
MPIPTPATVKTLIEKRNLESSSTPASTQSASSGQKTQSSSARRSTSSNSRKKISNFKISTESTSKNTATESDSSMSTTKRKNSSTKSAPSEKKPFERPEHLTSRPLRNHPGLEKIMDELRESEEINRKHGWYDRDRNGKASMKQNQPPRGLLKREYRVGGRRLGKTAALNSNKENN